MQFVHCDFQIKNLVLKRLTRAQGNICKAVVNEAQQHRPCPSFAPEHQTPACWRPAFFIPFSLHLPSFLSFTLRFFPAHTKTCERREKNPYLWANIQLLFLFSMRDIFTCLHVQFHVDLIQIDTPNFVFGILSSTFVEKVSHKQTLKLWKLNKS